ncbi:MAG: type I-U CRISPR-associated protein Cas5/Cas6, partial [Alphaproteobacteria bacterium]|nr:type I-U CRISPR-associated protein Cas5/Cas6 [Alphaproteobacteria bacterium]
GFTLPPAAHFVVYRWSPPPSRRHVVGTVAGPKITTLRFVLAGKPLPLLTDAVRIAELMKETLMSHEGRRAGVSWQISGHDAPGSHQHAFFLPEDADDDGHIDHVTVHAEAGFSPSTVAACTAVRETWGGDFGTWRVVLERCGGRETLAAAQVWESVTPYLHPLHAKARLGPEEQLRRELADRGFPAPCHVERLDHVEIAKRATKTVAFRRWRSKGGLTQPDTRGSFWRLTFDEQVSGPMAFGFACHYGLGMFRPAP